MYVQKYLPDYDPYRPTVGMAAEPSSVALTPYRSCPGIALITAETGRYLCAVY